MNKWFIKNKDGIFIGVISTIFTWFIFGIFKFLFGLFEFDQNKILVFLGKILKYSITLPIYLIVVFIILWITISKTYRGIKTRHRKLKIISAKYYTDSHSIDITNELNDKIEDNKLKTFLSNDIAGDPHKGKKKKGKVKYKIDGQENEKEYQEGDLIALP